MTTLVEQLEQAAERAEARARYWQSLGLEFAESRVSASEALSLRQRAARVRELERDLGRTDKLPLWPGVAEFFASLTGPIPSETAPVAPCETCKGAREVLWMYDRGPGSSPGNAMMPCPTCRPAAPKEGGAGEAKPTCSCTHAPEQHDSEGCQVMAMFGKPCPCAWSGARP